MRTVYPNLEKKMTESGVSPADLADHIKIPKLSCTLKLLGLLPWNFTEVVLICCLFGDAEAERLFVRLDIIS